MSYASVSEIIRPFENSGPFGSANGWKAWISLQNYMETHDKKYKMLLALEEDLYKIKHSSEQGSNLISAHMDNFNRVVRLIREYDPNYLQTFKIRETFIKSLAKARFLESLCDNCRTFKWTLEEFQNHLREKEILDQELTLNIPGAKKKYFGNKKRFKQRRTENIESDREDDNEQEEEVLDDYSVDDHNDVDNRHHNNKNKYNSSRNKKVKRKNSPIKQPGGQKWLMPKNIFFCC